MAIKPTEMRAGRKSSVVLWTVVAVLVIGAVGGAAWYLRPVTPPDAVVKQFFESMEKRDSTTAMALVMTKDRASLPQMQPVPSGTKLPDFKVGAPTIQSGRATVTLSLIMPELAQFTGSNQLDLPFSLAREGREWRIDMVESERLQRESILKSMPATPRGR